jgi:hypothetical protein
MAQPERKRPRIRRIKPGETFVLRVPAQMQPVSEEAERIVQLHLIRALREQGRKS